MAELSAERIKLSRILLSWRKILGLPRAELAAALSISAEYVRLLEQGRRVLSEQLLTEYAAVCGRNKHEVKTVLGLIRKIRYGGALTLRDIIRQTLLRYEGRTLTSEIVEEALEEIDHGLEVP